MPSLRRRPYAVGSTPFSLRLLVFLIVDYLVVGVHHVVLVRLRAGGLTCARLRPPPRPRGRPPPAWLRTSSRRRPSRPAAAPPALWRSRPRRRCGAPSWPRRPRRP